MGFGATYFGKLAYCASASLRCGIFKKRPAGGEIQIERRLERESARSLRHGVAAVKQRHRRDQDPSIGQTFGVDDRGKIVRALEFDLEAGHERLLHQRERLRIGRIDMFHQQFAVIDRIRQRDHAGSEQVVRRELVRLHDV